MKTKETGSPSPAKRTVRELLPLILFPIAALLISYLILAPQLRLLISDRETEPVVQQETTDSASHSDPADTLLPTDSSLQSQDDRTAVLSRLRLNAVSGSQDMLVQVQDESGQPVHGQVFDIILLSPLGELHYRSTLEGRCYIVELQPGLYTVTLGEVPGYAPTESVTCRVQEQGSALDPGLVEHPQMSADLLGGSDPIGWQSRNGMTYYYDASGQPVTGMQKIDGKLYYFNQNGEKASRLGVDVSCYNGLINWPLVKAQGIDFVLVRLGGRGWKSGLIYVDSMASAHLQGARDAGLQLGAYFYSAATTPAEAVQEAKLAIERLDGMPLEMPVYIDMEFSGDFPNGRADGLNAAQRVDIINAFCQTMNNSGYKAGVYSGESMLSTAVDFHSIAPHSVWLANYTENNALPGYEHPYYIWQFTDLGQVAGMGSQVDLNVIYE